MPTKNIFDSKVRPKDGQKVIYYFEPFNSWYCGQYSKESDSVFSKSGFTTWLPEVTMWMSNDLVDVKGFTYTVEHGCIYEGGYTAYSTNSLSQALWFVRDAIRDDIGHNFDRLMFQCRPVSWKHEKKWRWESSYYDYYMIKKWEN